MRHGLIPRLPDVRLADTAQIGAKAAQLRELIAAGARVPDGLVLTVAAGATSADELGRAASPKTGGALYRRHV